MCIIWNLHLHLDHLQPLTESKEGIADKFGVVFLSELFACLVMSLLPSLEEGLLKALMGLAKAQPQLLLLRPLTSWPAAPDIGFPFMSSADEETQYEEDEEDEEDEVIMNPLKSPPHLTRSAPLRTADDEEECLGLPSLWDSTLRRVQSPNPVEIRSKKSPEKLRLPHPTDLDLETFRSKEEAEAVAWLLGLLSSSASVTAGSPLFFREEDPRDLGAAAAVVADAKEEEEEILELSLKLLLSIFLDEWWWWW